MLKYIIVIILFLNLTLISCKHTCKHDEKVNNLKKKNIFKGQVFPEDSVEAKQIKEQQELVKKERKRRNLTGSGSLTGETPAPIRITLDYQLGSIDSDIEQIIRDGVDISVKYLSDVFMVYPLVGNNIIKSINGLEDGQEAQCLQVTDEPFTISLDDQSTGIPNSDLHLYITQKNESDQGYLAYANSCQYLNDRPTVGYVNFNLDFFISQYSMNSGASFDEHVETTLHEIMHSMGFAGSMIPFFRSRSNKLYSSEVIDTFLLEEEIRGLDTKILGTPLVRQVTRDHFGCPNAKGAQMENEGDSGSIASHWERTMFYNELMNPSGIQSDSMTSEFTLAFFADSNWYAYVDFSYAESTQWGQGRGCDFLNSCDAKFPEFNDNDEDYNCSFYHFGLGQSSPEDFSDSCNIFQIFSNTGCFDISGQREDLDQLAASKEVYQYDSKCFISDFVDSTYTGATFANYRCYQNQCTDQGLQVTIENNGQKYYVLCGFSEGGQVKNAPQGSGMTGSFQCPFDITEFCEYPVPCEDYCSNKGYCLRQNGVSKCHCLDTYAGSKCEVQCSNYISSTDGSCVSQCESNEYYLADKVCHQCASNCTYCTGPSNTDCQECPIGQYLQNESCVSVCSLGNFAEKKTGLCSQCDQKCENGCVGTSTNCIFVPVVYANYADAQAQKVDNPYGDEDDFIDYFKDDYIPPTGDDDQKDFSTIIFANFNLLIIFLLLIQ